MIDDLENLPKHTKRTTFNFEQRPIHDTAQRDNADSYDQEPTLWSEVL